MPQVNAAETSGRASAITTTLSRRLWSLDWTSILPWVFEDATVEHGTFDDALPFMAEHYARIFAVDPHDPRFYAEPMTPAKRRFFAEMDVFLLRSDRKIIGILMGHPTDWSTYYVRSAGCLPEYQGRSYFSRLMSALCEPLRAAGVARLESDVSPTNAPVIGLHTKQGFLVTSTSTSERWGLTLRLTKYLEPKAEKAFARQYCGVDTKNRNQQ